MESAEVMGAQKDRVRVKRKTLEAVLQQCHFALQQLASGCDDDDDDDDNVDGELEVPQDSAETSPAPTSCDTDTTEVKVLLNISYRFYVFFCNIYTLFNDLCECFTYT